LGGFARAGESSRRHVFRPGEYGKPGRRWSSLQYRPGLDEKEDTAVVKSRETVVDHRITAL
jgi:hypothetical protein